MVRNAKGFRECMPSQNVTLYPNSNGTSKVSAQEVLTQTNILGIDTFLGEEHVTMSDLIAL